MFEVQGGMLHNALLPGWSGISLGEPSEGVRTRRLGVSPLYPDPWADPQILLPSLCAPNFLPGCCSPAFAALNITYTGFPPFATTCTPLSSFLCPAPELSWGLGWGTLGARGGWGGVRGCGMLGHALPPGHRRAVGRWELCKDCPVPLAGTLSHHAAGLERLCLPVGGRLSSEASVLECLAAMSGFCHSCPCVPLCLCRTPTLWGGRGEAANKTPNTITAPLECSWIEGCS